MKRTPLEHRALMRLLGKKKQNPKRIFKFPEDFYDIFHLFSMKNDIDDYYCNVVYSKESLYLETFFRRERWHGDKNGGFRLHEAYGHHYTELHNYGYPEKLALNNLYGKFSQTIGGA